VCGDDQTLECYLPQQDPTQIPPSCGNPLKQCFVLAPEVTQAQRDLVRSLPQKYLKVVDGLAVEKTQAEQDQVDAVVAAQQAAIQAYKDETAPGSGSNDFCNTPSMQALTDRIKAMHDTINTQITNQQTTLQGQIDGLATANLASLKQGLTALNNATATMGTQMNDKYAQALTALARCTAALRFVK